MTRERLAGVVLLVAAIAGLLSCGSQDGSPTNEPPPTTPISATFSMTSSARQIPPPTDTDRHNALLMAYNAGVRGQYISIRWSQIEPQPGVYAFQSLVDTLSFLRSVGTFEVLIGIQTINTNKRELPADLNGLPFDDPRVLQRFANMLDALIPLLGTQARYISVGNEVDDYLASHPAEWAAYKTFVDAAAPRIRSLNPQLSVGSTTTFTGADRNAQDVGTLNANNDVVIFTYYPLNADFTPRAPITATPDFVRMRELAGNKPIVLQEVGFPTATALASSEALQAAFYANIFDNWAANQGQVRFLNIFLLHDITQTDCDAISAYYGLSAANFKAFLCSLGIRNADGTPKQAWTQITDKARAAGLPVN